MGKTKSKDKEAGEADKSQDKTMEEENSDRPPYEELVKQISIISKPLASKKLTKKLFKTIKKASKEKSIRRGVKEVGKALRKKETGFVVLAGDVSPIDVISHFPVLCEDHKVPYCYVPSRMDLGLASQTKRPTSVVLVKEKEGIKDYFKDCYSQIYDMPIPL
eukprot:Seg3388.2 transcript_id=Seg3388.2/GoldUCD/mRNA.D3Y31 product="H/ACA ribonucleoprotein complex subunit 2" protein_id=Seg3388.2/GoldUCD/D3Y31